MYTRSTQAVKMESLKGDLFWSAQSCLLNVSAMERPSSYGLAAPICRASASLLEGLREAPLCVVHLLTWGAADPKSCRIKTQLRARARLAAAAKALAFLGKRAETLLPPLEQIKPNHVWIGDWIKKPLDR
jgi:hypothetical protein